MIKSQFFVDVYLPTKLQTKTYCLIYFFINLLKLEDLAVIVYRT